MNYIKEIIFTAILCGIVTGLGTSKTSNTAKYVKFASSLAFLCVLLSPLMSKNIIHDSFSDNLINIAGSDALVETQKEDDLGLQLISNEICRAAINSAAEKYGVPTDHFSMNITIKDNSVNDYAIESAKVYVKNKALQDLKSDIQSYFEKILNCDAEVLILE